MRTALSALLLLAATPAAAQPAPAPAVVQFDHISVQAIGKGPPVVLIPGLSSPRAVWDGMAPALASGHRVYLVQVNGFGGDAPRANLKPRVLDGAIAELAAYLAREKVSDVAVIGHSMGGLLALMLARAHPALVGRVMAVDALPFVGEIFAPGASVAALEPRARMMRDQMAAAYGQPADPAAAQAIAAGNALHADSRAQVAAWVAKADARVTAEAFYEDMTTDLRGDVAALKAPVTLVYPAAGDALYRAAYARAKATFVPVADSGHFVMLDQPAAFRAAVAGFLK